MLKILRLLKQNNQENSPTKPQSANFSQAEKQAMSEPGIVGLAAIWDVYDMWI